MALFEDAGTWFADMFSFLKGGNDNPYYYSKTQRNWDDIVFAGMLVGGAALGGAILYHLMTGGKGLDLANIKIPGIHTPLFGSSAPAPVIPQNVPSQVLADPGTQYPPIMGPPTPPQVIPQIPAFNPPVIGAAMPNVPPPPPEPRPDSAFLATYRTQPDASRSSITYPTYYYYYPRMAPQPMYESRLSSEIASDYGVDLGRSQVFNSEEWTLNRNAEGDLVGISVHRNVRER